jgi:hypothetical protein
MFLPIYPSPSPHVQYGPQNPILFWKPPTHIAGNYVSLLVLILGG